MSGLPQRHGSARGELCAHGHSLLRGAAQYVLARVAAMLRPQRYRRVSRRSRTGKGRAPPAIPKYSRTRLACSFGGLDALSKPTELLGRPFFS